MDGHCAGPPPVPVPFVPLRVSRRSPLLDLHRQAEGLLSPYGSAPDERSTVLLVEAFDRVQIEYASIRSACAVFDQPHRATLVVRGPERLDFLNRMLTQELKGFAPFTMRRSFWLNRKGRIDADLRLINLPDRLLIDVDVHAAERARAGLESFIISEDCSLTDETEQWHRLSLHGPGAAALLAGMAEPGGGLSGVPVGDIQPGQVSIVRIAGVEVIVDRQDTTGEIGLELLVPAQDALGVYEALSGPRSASSPDSQAATARLARRVGWHALNIARIEAGTPLYLVDFGPDSLPHETGNETLNDRVSFKKGCYLGQEVVARMNALGHPKQRLVGLRIDADVRAPEPLQAVTGAPVLASAEPGAAPIGAVTSSCVSPMLSQAHVAFAMVKWAHAKDGEQLSVQAGNHVLRATTRESLRFIARR